MMHYNSTNFVGKEPKKAKKKKPTGILKDLAVLRKYSICNDIGDGVTYIKRHRDGELVKWSDVEAIIKKY